MSGSGEQPVEDILASIRLAMSGGTPPAPGPAHLPAAEGDDVLELTRPLAPVPPAAGRLERPALVSATAAETSRQALAALSQLRLADDPAGDTLAGLVRELLRPMLKDWLDANLAQIVERIVAREVARVVGR